MQLVQAALRFDSIQCLLRREMQTRGRDDRLYGV